MAVLWPTCGPDQERTTQVRHNAVCWVRPDEIVWFVWNGPDLGLCSLRFINQILGESLQCHKGLNDLVLRILASVHSAYFGGK